MADPSYAELIAQFKNIVRLCNETYKFGVITSSTNYLTGLDTLTQSLENDFSALIQAAAEQGASQLSTVISALQPAFDGWVLAMGKLVQETSQDLDTIHRAIYRYFIDNTKSVRRRGITRGAVSAGANNTGNGTVYPLVVDSEGYSIEDMIGWKSSTNYVTRIECIADRFSGAEVGAEQFRIRTADVGPNPRWPQIDHSKGSSQIRVASALVKDDANGAIQNCGFSTYVSGASHPFTGWTASSYTGITQDTTVGNAYRPLRSTYYSSTRTYAQAAFASTSAAALTQYIRNINPRVPYFIGVRFIGDGSADGNMLLSVGQYGTSVVTATVAVSTSWQLLLLHSSTATQAWPERFMKQDLKVAIERSGHAAGNVYVDCVFVVPFDYFNGRWFKIVAGTTEFVRGSTGTPNDPPDFFTFTDTVAGVDNKGSSSYWYNRLSGGHHLPTKTLSSASETDYS